jgi:hypothetical protein
MTGALKLPQSINKFGLSVFSVLNPTLSGSFFCQALEGTREVVSKQHLLYGKKNM